MSAGHCAAFSVTVAVATATFRDRRSSSSAGLRQSVPNGHYQGLDSSAVTSLGACFLASPYAGGASRREDDADRVCEVGRRAVAVPELKVEVGRSAQSERDGRQRTIENE